MQFRKERDTMSIVEVTARSANAALVAEFQEIKFHKDLNSYIFVKTLILGL